MANWPVGRAQEAFRPGQISFGWAKSPQARLGAFGHRVGPFRPDHFLSWPSGPTARSFKHACANHNAQARTSGHTGTGPKRAGYKPIRACTAPKRVRKHLPALGGPRACAICAGTTQPGCGRCSGLAKHNLGDSVPYLDTLSEPTFF